MECFLICILVIALLVLALLPTEEGDELAAKALLVLFCLGFFSIGVFTLSHDAGIKEGAYNQLRGKYEVTYVIDKDSCVVDTIININ